VDAAGDPLPEGAALRLGSIRFRAASQVYSLACSPDGRWLASLESQAVRLWDVATGKEQWAFPGQFGLALPMLFAADSKSVYAANSTGGIQEIDVAQGKERRRYAPVHKGRFAMALSPDGRSLITGGQDGMLRQWLTVAGIELRQLGAHQGPIIGLAVVEGRVLSAGLDGAVRIWDLAKGADVKRLNLPFLKGRAPNPGFIGNLPGTAAFSPDGKLVAIHVQGAENAIHIWDLAKDALHAKVPLLSTLSRLTPLFFSPNGQMLACLDADKSLRLIGVASGRELRRLELPYYSYSVLGTPAAFSPDGQRFFLARTSRLSAAGTWSTAKSCSKPRGIAAASPALTSRPTARRSSRSAPTAPSASGPVPRKSRRRSWAGLTSSASASRRPAAASCSRAAPR
jgi:WD40 repeat protein